MSAILPPNSPSITPNSSVKDVINYLQQLRLNNHTFEDVLDVFKDETVNGKVFLNLDKSDLNELNIYQFKRRNALYNHIQLLKKHNALTPLNGFKNPNNNSSSNINININNNISNSVTNGNSIHNNSNNGMDSTQNNPDKIKVVNGVQNYLDKTKENELLTFLQENVSTSTRNSNENSNSNDNEGSSNHNSSTKTAEISPMNNGNITSHFDSDINEDTTNLDDIIDKLTENHKIKSPINNTSTNSIAFNSFTKYSNNNNNINNNNGNTSQIPNNTMITNINNYSIIPPPPQYSYQFREVGNISNTEVNILQSLSQPYIVKIPAIYEGVNDKNTVFLLMSEHNIHQLNKITSYYYINSQQNKSTQQQQQQQSTSFNDETKTNNNNNNSDIPSSYNFVERGVYQTLQQFQSDILTIKVDHGWEIHMQYKPKQKLPFHTYVYATYNIYQNKIIDIHPIIVNGRVNHVNEKGRVWCYSDIKIDAIEQVSSVSSAMIGHVKTIKFLKMMELNLNQQRSSYVVHDPNREYDGKWIKGEPCSFYLKLSTRSNQKCKHTSRPIFVQIWNVNKSPHYK